jgi:hypothetical protein
MSDNELPSTTRNATIPYWLPAAVGLAVTVIGIVVIEFGYRIRVEHFYHGPPYPMPQRGWITYVALIAIGLASLLCSAFLYAKRCQEDHQRECPRGSP